MNCSLLKFIFLKIKRSSSTTEGVGGLWSNLHFHQSQCVICVKYKSWHHLMCMIISSLLWGRPNIFIEINKKLQFSLSPPKHTTVFSKVWKHRIDICHTKPFNSLNTSFSSTLCIAFSAKFLDSSNLSSAALNSSSVTFDPAKNNSALIMKESVKHLAFISVSYLLIFQWAVQMHVLSTRYSINYITN